ncbi:DUF6255 family natural product biosynthesis protein [Streptomyces sp. NPDC026206]|uniref:DUF6255 family natural product biosynthesis protein n=1 Tax=Streptomyces sp. NPDC026206 TaxID=3157089 RepID=UPI0033C8170C
MRGRVASRCPHHAGWTHTGGGEARCDTCGTRRFSDYGALRPSGLPHPLTPSGAARRAADRAAARRVGEAMRGGTRCARGRKSVESQPRLRLAWPHGPREDLVRLPALQGLVQAAPPRTSRPRP